MIFFFWNGKSRAWKAWEIQLFRVFSPVKVNKAAKVRWPPAVFFP